MSPRSGGTSTSATIAANTSRPRKVRIVATAEPAKSFTRLARRDGHEQQRDDQRHDRHSDRVHPDLADRIEERDDPRRNVAGPSAENTPDDQTGDETDDDAMNAHSRSDHLARTTASCPALPDRPARLARAGAAFLVAPFLEAETTRLLRASHSSLLGGRLLHRRRLARRSDLGLDGRLGGRGLYRDRSRLFGRRRTRGSGTAATAATLAFGCRSSGRSRRAGLVRVVLRATALSS